MVCVDVFLYHLLFLFIFPLVMYLYTLDASGVGELAHHDFVSRSTDAKSWCREGNDATLACFEGGLNGYY